VQLEYLNVHPDAHDMVEHSWTCRDFCENSAVHLLQMKIVVKKLLGQELVVGAPSQEFDTQAKQELSLYALKMAAVSK